MKLQLMLSGVGGQGVMSIGELFCSAVAGKNKTVTFSPTYGAEKRGGRTMCQIVVSDKTTSPIVSSVDVLMVMDEKSLDDYADYVKKGGTLILNSNLVKKDANRDDVKICKVPLNDMAVQAGNAKCLNMVALGCVLKFQSVLSLDDIKAELPGVFPGKKSRLIPVNELALDMGYAAVEA